MEIRVHSRAFGEGDSIPRKHTCNGEGVSPQIEWEASGDHVESFAVICEDPDAPVGTFTHWVVYNLPADSHELPERIPNRDRLPGGALHGTNSLHRTGYTGPCPPKGIHRYFFKVFALDTVLDLAPGAGKDELVKKMHGHILGEGSLMGKYGRA